jgi:general secretion pathway protein F
MRTFEYKGFDHAGQSARGLVQALDVKDAREKLAQQGVLAEWLEPAGARSGRLWSRRNRLFSLDTRAAFYRELASVIAAGLPLAQALNLLMDAPEMGHNRTVIAGIRDRISEGANMADAVRDASPQVTAFEQAIIQTGEVSGQLDAALNRLADFLEEERNLRDRLVSAMIYPVVILVLSVVVGLALLLFMLPAFRSLLLESGMTLPWITRAVMAGARAGAWLLPMALVAVLVAGVRWRRSWQRSGDFRVAWDRRLHRLPLCRSFYGVLVNVRFTRTLALLLGSGLPLLEALKQAAAASASPWVQELIDHEVEAIRHGSSLSDALARVPPLAATLPGWTRAGEASGDLSGMLEHAADRSQQVWQRRITRTMTLVESALVIMVGLFVFLLALAIILPILSINQTFG